VRVSSVKYPVIVHVLTYLSGRGLAPFIIMDDALSAVHGALTYAVYLDESTRWRGHYWLQRALQVLIRGEWVEAGVMSSATENRLQWLREVAATHVHLQEGARAGLLSGDDDAAVAQATALLDEMRFHERTQASAAQSAFVMHWEFLRVDLPTFLRMHQWDLEGYMEHVFEEMVIRYTNPVYGAMDECYGDIFCVLEHQPGKYFDEALLDDDANGTAAAELERGVRFSALAKRASAELLRLAPRQSPRTVVTVLRYRQANRELPGTRWRDVVSEWESQATWRHHREHRGWPRISQKFDELWEEARDRVRMHEDPMLLDLLLPSGTVF
jgi:hypothetical protein